MSNWQYEQDRAKVERIAKKREIAEKYVRECLVITDGSIEKALARIGSERFEDTVLKVMAALPEPKKAGD